MKLSELKIIFITRLIKGNNAVIKLIKHVTAFDYIDKILIVLSATSSGVCIISCASASFNLIFSLTTGIIKNY